MQRILIVGSGSIGKRHLSNARNKFPGSQIFLLAQFSGSNVLNPLADFISSSVDEALSFAPELAIIANPSPFHCTIADKLCVIGCKLLIEKPLSSCFAEAISFVEASKKYAVDCQVAYNLRHLSSLQAFRKSIRNNVIGNVLSVRSSVGQYLPEWRKNTDYRKGVSARQDLGGGVLLELSHEIDYIQWIFGEIAWVSAHLSNISDLDVDVEDSAFLTMGICSISNHETIVSLTMDFVRRDSHRTCCAIGDRGTLIWDGLSGLTNLYDPSLGRWLIHDQSFEPMSQSYEKQFDYLVSNYAQSNDIHCDLEFALKTLAVIEAARLSSANNCSKISLKSLRI